LLKADALGSQVTVAACDAQAALQSLTALQKQYDNLSAQQSQWVELCHISEQMKTLTNLIAQADNAEVNDLKRLRGRCNVLEDEHSALQKRFKDQEAKVANSERAALVARQSLLQAQQRASEWESRAKEYEGRLDMAQTKLDQAEQTQAQLDTDYSLAALQLEEQEADHRLAKVRKDRHLFLSQLDCRYRNARVNCMNRSKL
jgi:chromosome segregation ATPase